MASIVAHGIGCITINAAFLQEVKESNCQLWETLHRLRSLRLLDLDAKNASRQLVMLLGELRDQLALEFSLEETYGYISNAQCSTLAAEFDASAARMQHQDLYLQLHEICEQVEEAQYRGTIGRDLMIYFGAFEVFDDALRAHESLEAEMIRCGLGIRRWNV